MAQRVIDFLEVVQVNEQNRQLQAVALAFLDFLGEPVAQHAPVGQAGQRVEMGLLPDQRFGLFAFGDVGVRANHAQRLALGVAADDHAAREHPLPGAVFALNAVLVDVGRGQPVKVGLPVNGQLRQVVGVGAAVQRLGHVGQLVFVKAVHGFEVF